MPMMKSQSASPRRIIEVRGFKWPHRPISVAHASVLGEDQFGYWLGITKGSPWWTADRSRSGIFLQSFVKLIPTNAFWSVCFYAVDPIVDVDIILPVSWMDDVLEEIDLELDILRAADGEVWVRDQERFEHVRTAWNMPDAIAVQAKATCEHVRSLVEQGIEPFESVGISWLSRFITNIDTTETSN
jgi:uncharacterized protein